MENKTLERMLSSDIKMNRNRQFSLANQKWKMKYKKENHALNRNESVIGLLCWIKSWKWNPNKKMTPWYLSGLNNQRKKIRRWYRNELNHQFHYWIKKKKRRNPRKKMNGIFIFLYWIKYWERKSVHDIEWSEMKKKKLK